MSKLNVNSILFNAAGAGVVLIVAGYIVRSFIIGEDIPQCSQRYTNGQQLSLQSARGVALSPLELQARVSSREWGLLNNARVVEASDKSAMYLQVAMTSAANEPVDSEAAPTTTNGVGFAWQPQSMSGTRAACLSYRVYLPKDFSFAGPGWLPGLFAASSVAELDEAQPKAGFVSRLGWKKDGVLGMEFRTPASAGHWLAAKGMRWPTDRWVTIQQEIVLNSKDKANGLVRLWIDGELKVETNSINLGATEHTVLSGVVADIGYNRDRSQTGRLTVSPFLVQKQ